MADPESSNDSLFASDEVAEKDAKPKQASASGQKPPLEDSAKDGARADPRKEKAPAREYTEDDIDAELADDPEESIDIDHGAHGVLPDASRF